MRPARAVGGSGGSLLALFFRLPEAAAFDREFGAQRRSGDVSFLLIHCLVASGYIFKAPKLLSPPPIFMFFGSWVTSALFLALPRGRQLQLRTPIFAALKFFQACSILYTLTNDFWPPAAKPLHWPIFLFSLAFTGRVIPHLAVGLGLQLPAALDLPLQLLGTLTVMSTAMPRQCFPGAAPPGQRTLFQVDPNKFREVQALLDFPFAPFAGAAAALPLSDRGLCASVYLWAQLVVAFVLPAAALLVAEAFERCRFLRGRGQQGGPVQRQGGQDGAQSGGSGSGGRPAETNGGAGFAGFPWTYTLFAAELAWLLIRTAVAKLEHAGGWAGG